MRHEVELWGDEAQAVEDQSFDGMASAHKAHCRVLPRRLVDDRGDPEFFKHARDKAQMS